MLCTANSSARHSSSPIAATRLVSQHGLPDLSPNWSLQVGAWWPGRPSAGPCVPPPRAFFRGQDPCSAGIATSGDDVEAPLAPAVHVLGASSSRPATFWYISPPPPKLMAQGGPAIPEDYRLGRAHESASPPPWRLYFTHRLISQKQSEQAHHRRLPGRLPAIARTSPNNQTGKAPSLTGLLRTSMPRLSGRFLDHLEHSPGQPHPKSRNARLAAIHSLFNRGALSPRARRPHRQRAGHTGQTG